MALQQFARNRHTRGDVAARWLFVAACGAFALGGALASCATGGLGVDGPGDDSGTGGDVTPTSEDSGKGIGNEDATRSGVDAGALDSSGGPPPGDSSLEATDAGPPPPVDGSTQDASSPIEASPVDASSPVDVAPPVDTGGGTDASGTEDAGSCGGWPAWFAGTTAQQVQNLGERYTCIQPGWCDQSGTSAVLAWEPGVGSAWQQAWKDSGPCP
jgi:hypothetical protein